MKPYPWRCGNCKAKAVNPAVVPVYRTRLAHDGRSYEVEVPDLEVARCDACGTIVLDDAAGGRLEEALRREVGLLGPAEIRAAREALGLTQKQLAEALQVAESTLSRWETGAQIQQRAMDRFLRIYFRFPPVQAYLREGGMPGGSMSPAVVEPGTSGPV